MFQFWQIDIEPETNAVGPVFDTVTVALQFLNGPDDRQPQAIPAAFARAGFIHFIKTDPDFSEAFFRDRLPRVGDKDADMARIGGGTDRQANLSFSAGMVNGVVQLIGQDLLDPQAVGVYVVIHLILPL